MRSAAQRPSGMTGLDRSALTGLEAGILLVDDVECDRGVGPTLDPGCLWPGTGSSAGELSRVTLNSLPVLRCPGAGPRLRD